MNNDDTYTRTSIIWTRTQSRIVIQESKYFTSHPCTKGTAPSAGTRTMIISCRQRLRIWQDSIRQSLHTSMAYVQQQSQSSVLESSIGVRMAIVDCNRCGGSETTTWGINACFQWECITKYWKRLTTTSVDTRISTISAEMCCPCQDDSTWNYRNCPRQRDY